MLFHKTASAAANAPRPAPDISSPWAKVKTTLDHGKGKAQVSFDEKEQVYVVEGPRIEKMLGYTNLDSEKGFQFFQKFMHTNGIIEELEALGIAEGDTVKMYELQFDYYK